MAIISFVGNVCLILAAIVSIYLASFIYDKNLPRSGEMGVGYFWTLLLLNVVFAVLMLVATLAISWKGGFQWISPKSSGSRFLLVATGLFSAVFTSALSGLLKDESGPVPMLLRFFANFAPVLIPMLLIGAGFVLLNEELRNASPSALYRWPLYLSFGMGVIGVASALAAWMAQSYQNSLRQLERNIEDNERNHQNHLQSIDQCDVMKDMVLILVFTDANHDEEVRSRALAKIKTHPDWQQELIRLLDTDWAPEVFTFLASNPVDDKARFAEPLRRGVLVQARLIRESIRNAWHPSNFYAEQFSWQVDRVLRSVEAFQDQAVDYLPAVREVRAALNEPSEYEKPYFTCTSVLDKWIKKHAR